MQIGRQGQTITDMLDLAIKQSADAVAIADIDRSIVYANKAFTKLFGYSPESMIGMKTVDLRQEGAAATAVSEHINKFGSWLGEYTYVKANRRLFKAHALITSICDDNGMLIGYLSILRDVTKLKRAQEKLKISAMQWQDTFNAIGDAICILGTDNKILRCNDAMAELVERTTDEVIGQRCCLFFHGSDKPLKGCPVLRSMKTHQRETNIFQYDSKWTEVSIYPEFDVNGAYIGAVHIASDITERKLMNDKLQNYSDNLEQLVKEKSDELLASQKKLLKSEKFAALGQLASGVAHDLRNPLSVISNVCYLLTLRLKDADEKVKDSLKLQKQELVRTNKLIEGLLDFVRVKAIDYKKQSIKLTITETLSEVEIPNNVELIEKYQKALPEVRIDKLQLIRVFANIINNALQAMPGGGKLTITAKQNANTVEIDFQDTGEGITPENRRKVFEPLFTTKARTGGTGLGLPICRTIIKAHNGSIRVKSDVGTGTTFTVKLPV